MLTKQTVMKTIGNTTYIVEYAVGKSAKETVYGKVERMILQDLEADASVRAPLPGKHGAHSPS